MENTDASAPSAAESLAVAERFFAAIEAGDINAIYETYAPDAVIWHNFDNVEQTRDENVRMLGWSVKHLGNMRYTDVRRTATDTGFAQQHVLRAINPKGVEIEVPAALFVSVRDGRITRLDEYLDSRHVALITGA
jgi:ketosteroid isomerase-like protein